jgi:hypothetical protein
LLLQKSQKGSEQKTTKNSNFKLKFSPVTARQAEEESSPYSCRNRPSIQSSQLNGIDVVPVEETNENNSNNKKYDIHFVS